MKSKSTLYTLVTLTALSLLFLAGCGSDGIPVNGGSFPTDSEIFLDEFGPNVTFEAFLGSKLDAVGVSESESQSGSRSLVVTIPAIGNPDGSYAGGAFTATIGRDLTGYNALTFWAKASTPATLDVVGLGNDNTGTSRFTAEVSGLPLTTSWTKFVIPIPLPAKLTAERGLFYFAEGSEDGSANTLWFDEVKFENLGTVSNPRPEIPTLTLDVEISDTITIGNGTVRFDVNDNSVEVSAMPGYFDFFSSSESVVNVAGNGVISAVGVGMAELTALLGSVQASGTVSVEVAARSTEPTVAAPVPTRDPADVVSLFSDTYTNETIDTWSADWDMADFEDFTIGADLVKKYTNVSFAGIEFTSNTVDASAMTFFHIDIWTPNSTAGAEFKVKLVDFGSNGSFGGGDDSEHEVTVEASALSSEEWVSIDIPFTAFAGLSGRAHLAQLIISGDLTTVYVDNIYFYFAELPTSPQMPAPVPDQDAGDVVSLFSDAYTDVTVDTWSAVFDIANVEDFAVGSDNTKKYTDVLFAVAEMRTSPVDVSSMTHFHLDVWTPDPTGASKVFKIKLVDFGPNGVYNSGGVDDVEHELGFGSSTMQSLAWVSIDVPLSAFSDLTTTGHIGQLILSGGFSTFYVDNIYFYDSGVASTPQEAAPTPTRDPADVISFFSDAYTDVTVDTWSAEWDSADVADIVIDSDNVKRYSNLLFAGIEFLNPTIDGSEMTQFHLDLWTPDPTSAPATFKIKLVDFGANGQFDAGGNDDVEHEITLTESVLNTGSWVSLDIPLTEFVGLTTKGHLAQLIMSGDPNTVYIDNVYLYK